MDRFMTDDVFRGECFARHAWFQSQLNWHRNQPPSSWHKSQIRWYRKRSAEVPGLMEYIMRVTLKRHAHALAENLTRNNGLLNYLRRRGPVHSFRTAP